MTDPIKQKTANQVDDVLQGYLDQLLVTATEPLTVVDSDKPEVVAASLKTAERAATAHIRQQPAAGEVKVSLIEETVAEVKEFAEPQTLARTLTVPQPEIPVTEAPLISEPFSEVQESGIVSAEIATEETQDQVVLQQPELDWRSTQGVECLIFKVAGLKLAIPLSLLGGVHNASDKTTPLFGQANWSLGVWQSDEQKLTIVDSAALIMPERGISLVDQGYHFIIQLDRSPWALACQEICDTITLVHDSIKWRGDNSKRPWLAGTVIDEMCALIDVPNLMDMLKQNTRH